MTELCKTAAILHICIELCKLFFMALVSEGIKNIIFDLGNVLLDVDFDKSIDAFKKLGISDSHERYSKASQQGFFRDFEKGDISGEEFLSQLHSLTQNKVNEKNLLSAWNAMLGDFPEKRINLLKRLKSRYRLFLLSNTNIIHYDIFTKKLRDQYGTSLSELLEKEYYSFDLHLRKPDPEIFKYALSNSGLIAHETLYIDDTLEHIESARQSGIIAYHLIEGEDLIELLKDF